MSAGLANTFSDLNIHSKILMTNFGQAEQQKDTAIYTSGRSINHENNETMRQPRDMWQNNTQTWRNNGSHGSRTQQSHNPTQAWKNNNGYEINTQRNNRAQQPQPWNNNTTMSGQHNWQNNMPRTWETNTNNNGNQQSHNNDRHANQA